MLEDRWIFSRLRECAGSVNDSIRQYRYHEAAQQLWQFFWHDLCDWYVELKKLRFEASSGLTSDWKNALAVFEGSLRLLHPVMPFITEELWQRMKGSAPRPVSLALAEYPRGDASNDLFAESVMDTLQSIITEARTLRAEMKLDPKITLEGSLYSTKYAAEVARDHGSAIQRLANVRLQVFPERIPHTGGVVRSTAEFDLVLNVPQANLAEQRKRLEKEREQLEKNIANSNRQLGDEKFLSRAPAQVIDSLKTKLVDYETQLAKVRKALNGFS